MSRLDTAASSDTGQVRKANEDAWHAGDSVFAVADGMGGHVAGEVASAAALEPIARLDGRVFGDPDEALAALRDAVVAANSLVHGKSSSDPRFEGMGTTLTAAMIEHRRLHIAHVGDSRAYLFRDDLLVQLTHDHTLVQALVDEGQIGEEDAASHPQRSIITRAIGVDSDVAVDAMSFELEGGDRVLLCSDGLTTVVADQDIAEVLRTTADLDDAVDHLVERANAAGGPDNITVVAFDFDTGRQDRPAGGDRDADAEHSPVVSANVPIRVSSRESVRTPDGSNRGWAHRLGSLGELGSSRTPPYPREEDSAGPSLAQRVGAGLLAVALLAALVVAGGRWLIGRSYYVGVAGEEVTIYQGVPTDLGPIDLSWIHERTGLDTDEVPDFYRERLVAGIPAADLADARRIVQSAPRRDADGQPTAPGATPSPTASPGASGSQ